MSKEKSQESESVAIEKERQKTKRLFIRLSFTILILIISGFIVYVNIYKGGKGKIEIDPTSGKVVVSVEKPVLEQVSVEKANYKADDKTTVSFTTGKVNTEVIKELKASSHQDIAPDKFTGKNLINEEAGFLLTVKNPQRWQVSYNPYGLTTTMPVNMIHGPQGSNLNIVIEKLVQPMDIRTYTTLSIQNIIQMGLLSQMPEVSYDDDSQTSFFYIVYPAQGMSQYQKIVLKNKNTAYIVTATYTTSDQDVINELSEMAGSFTLIDS